MSFPRPRGVIAATATPIDAEQRPDLPRLVDHCRALLDEGCDFDFLVHGRAELPR